jgi:hypothetical protein
MVRERVLLVAADSYPTTLDASKRAALTRATRVTPVEMKLVEWDTVRGRLACVATWSSMPRARSSTRTFAAKRRFPTA